MASPWLHDCLWPALPYPALDVRATLFILDNIPQQLQRPAAWERKPLCRCQIHINLYTMKEAHFPKEFSLAFDPAQSVASSPPSAPLLHGLYPLQEHRELTSAIGFALCNMKCHPGKQGTRRL